MDIKNLITPANCKKIAAQYGFKIFSDRLNIWGIRTPKGEFNDYFIFFPAIDEDYLVVQGTTEPSAGYIPTIFKKGKSNPNGIAVLVSNSQYLNCWKFGLHKGKYKALQQNGNKFLVTRHKKDEGDNYYNLRQYTDVGGLNLHTTKLGYTLNSILGFSEGCQVIWNAEVYFEDVIPLIEKYNQKTYDYTLVDSYNFEIL
jgi:hypothetical protein